MIWSEQKVWAFLAKNTSCKVNKHTNLVEKSCFKKNVVLWLRGDEKKAALVTYPKRITFFQKSFVTLRSWKKRLSNLNLKFWVSELRRTEYLHIFVSFFKKNNCITFFYSMCTCLSMCLSVIIIQSKICIYFVRLYSFLFYSTLL